MANKNRNRKKNPPSSVETVLQNEETILDADIVRVVDVGVTLNDRFKITERLGRGGMGVVYKAWDNELEQDVAIKVLNSDIASPTLIERMKRELKLTRKVSHKNIAVVYDINTYKGYKYISMEYIKGETLLEKIVQKDRFSFQEFTEIALQITRAIKAAHDEKVIHRDLKPSNIMITPDNKVKLLDFGIAYSSEEKQLTKTNAMIGTMEYISPEQARGEIPSVQSDIYSLGIIFFNMLTGDVPFKSNTPLATAMKHVTDKIPLVSSVLENVPTLLDDIVARCSEKEPKKRYKSCDDVITDLEELEKQLNSGNISIRKFKPVFKKVTVPVIGVFAAILVLFFIILLPMTGSKADIDMEITLVGERMDLMGNVVEVILKDGTTLYSKDGFQVHITLSRDAYLYVVDIDSADKVEMLYPRDEIDLKPPLKGGVKYVLPGDGLWYRLDETMGRENLFMLASAEPYEKLESVIEEFKKMPPGEKFKPDFDLAAEMRIIERGISKIDNGRPRPFILSNGSKVEKSPEIIKGDGIIIKSLSFNHK